MAARQIHSKVTQSAVGALVTIGVLLVVSLVISAVGGALVGLTAPFIGPAYSLGLWLVVGVALGIKLFRS